MTQTDFEPALSFVTLTDDGYTLLLNGESKYSVGLPMDISRKNASEKLKAIESVILNACNSFGVDYVSMDNIRQRTKEIVDLFYERARVNKNYVVPPSHPVISEKYNNDYLEYLIDCIKRTVKEEDALPRQIMYTVLSAHSSDPINLGVLAPTSTGKTYPIIESAKFTPLGKEVRIVGSMTPKVLIREDGVLVDKQRNPIAKEVRRLKNAITEAKVKIKNKKDGKNAIEALEQFQDELAELLKGSAYIVDMSGKTLLFLEPPKPELMDLIKPILSHDHWEMEHPFVDKIASGGLEVKRVITRGWPACIFCSAKDESKWETWSEIESRFMIVSPNMVKQKYHAGNRLIAQKKGLPNALKQKLIIAEWEKELGKQCFLYLKHQIQQATATTDSPVWIPYAMQLAEILPADKGQDNRTANRFFTMLSIVTLSKAQLRYRLILGDEDMVISTLEDLRETLHIMQNMTGMPPHKLKFYEQYIIPLYKNKKEKLRTKDICEFYNCNAPKGAPRLNSDNIRKTYIEELVNHRYIEQERDEDTSARQYIYTPLVDASEEEIGEQQQQRQGEANDGRSNRSNFGQFVQNLHFSKLLLPENHSGIPEDWLKHEISQFQDERITSRPLRILDPKGNDISIEDFIQHYEPSITGLKLKDFVKMPRRIDGSKSVNLATLEPSEQDSDEKITINANAEEKKSPNHSNFGQFDRLDDLTLKQLAEKAMKDNHGNNKGYFTKDDWVFSCQMWPNLHWTIDEAEQMLYALLEEGKIQETEPGSRTFATTASF